MIADPENWYEICVRVERHPGGRIEVVQEYARKGGLAMAGIICEGPYAGESHWIPIVVEAIKAAGKTLPTQILTSRVLVTGAGSASAGVHREGEWCSVAVIVSEDGCWCWRVQWTEARRRGRLTGTRRILRDGRAVWLPIAEAAGYPSAEDVRVGWQRYHDRKGQ